MTAKPTYEELEKRLRELETGGGPCRHIADTALVGMFRTRLADGRFLAANRALAQMLGFDAVEDLIARYVTSDNYTDPARRGELLSRLEKGGRVDGFEIELARADGGRIQISLSAVAYPDKGYLEGLAVDISGRKQAEEALRESERRYRSLVDNAPDLLYRTNLDGTIAFISPSVYPLSGYTVEEAMGMKMAEEVYAVAEERQVFLEKLTRSGQVMNFEARLKRKDGSIWWASTNARFYRDRDGNIMGVEGITRDITGLKEAQNALKESERRLQREDKMRSLGLMAGGIAHDLNNILSGIVSYPDLLLMDLPADSPMRKPIETIKDSGQRATDVVSDLLTIARGVTTGKAVLNLNPLIEEYLDSAEHRRLQMRYPGVQFRTELAPDLLNTSCSKVHIKKILMNLTANAAEAITGKGVVTVATRNRYLDASLRGYAEIRCGEYILLSVSDDGSGIPPQSLDRIFEPFYTKKILGKSGTGLGLAVVWNTVQDHDGYINVTSDAGGTVFDLYFPVVREEIAAGPQAAPISDYAGKGQKILVVDDEPAQRALACRLLTRLGYRAESVSSGEAAVAYLQEKVVDLVVLDMIMAPGIDGLETYRRILDRHPGQRAIITSGFSETERVRQAQRLGAGAYVKKPYLLETIGLAVKRALGR